ncbi:MAG: cytochrome c biogenesis protein ResB [Mediterranea sp.]|jgi:hypothetical protein|nr:cytochrome c biogenesis protein ResB [Mediterranea sp.]
MWKRPWSYREGLLIGAGLFVAGEALQWSIGGIRWSLLAFPVNVVAAAVYIAGLLSVHGLRRRVYLFGWLSSPTAAVSALLWTATLTVAMGLIRQRAPGQPAVDSFGFTQMISAWPFVLLYLWMLTVLGLTILRTTPALNLRRLPLFAAHVGLFVALIAATLGSADMQRLKMTVRTGQTEWRATDEAGRITELPLALELKHFTMDEYPPKLMLIDNSTGEALPKEMPANLLLEDSLTTGKLGNWYIRVQKLFEEATTAALITATHTASGAVRTGWVSCGSFAFPYKSLKLDSLTSVVMPHREPKRFASQVTVFTQAGERHDAVVEVNRPLEIGGWNIYQLSYDANRGRWSEISVFEWVRDPWLPVVYGGMFLLALGAVGMFLDFGTKRKEHAV